MSGTTSHRAGEEDPYEMSLSLNVLNHLGLNLYSNVPQVLSEAVANSWDADAELVEINIDPDEERIEIADNGHGMSKYDVNNRYLHVGYQRREDEERANRTEKHNRPVMGRKGIGKLSLFSIAKCVEVYTTDGDEEHAFRMEVDEIRKAIKQDDKPENSGSEPETYRPTPIEPNISDDLEHGTKVVLTDLKKQIHQAEHALRKRLARRFSVLGAEHDFNVTVNGKEVRVTDRDYFHKVQFLWTFGDHDKYADYCSNAVEHEKLDGTTPDGHEIRGWIGTVEKPSHLVESHPGLDEKDDLNKVTLMVRGKMAQEDLLDDTNDGRLYTKYVVGEIHADFLDLDDKDDIATSSREKMVKDDPRYEDLQMFLSDRLNDVANTWTDLRNEQGSEEARKVRAIDEWFESLGEDKRQRARKLLGKINQITTDSEDEKRELFKHSVLAFENLRYKNSLNRLDQISPEDLQALSEVFIDLDDIEATLYHQIVSQRLEVIEEMREKVEQNELEEVLQDHLSQHPWLLDPSWERATDNVHKEKQIRSLFDDIDAGLTEDEKKGRVDIKYIRTSGTHIIVELKRPDRLVDSFELAKQVSKYRSALRKALRDAGEDNYDIEVVCIVGRDLRDWDGENGRTESRNMLKQKDTKVMKYDELLTDSYEAYKEYLEQKEEAGRVSKLIQEIETGEIFEE